jgi:hypothetical protein
LRLPSTSKSTASTSTVGRGEEQRHHLQRLLANVTDALPVLECGGEPIFTCRNRAYPRVAWLLESTGRFGPKSLIIPWVRSLNWSAICRPTQQPWFARPLNL